jgi:uncharacterized protein YacL
MSDVMVLSLTIVGVLIVLLGILRLRHVSLQALVLGVIGVILGLLLGALASVPLSKLPSPFGAILPIAVSVVFVAVLMGIVMSRRVAILNMLPFLRMAEPEQSKVIKTDDPAPSQSNVLPQILVDTSVIIDGRIADIATAGFVPGRLVVPRFVLAELQNIADSDDAMRRGRGRRGLDVLSRLRDMPDIQVDIIEDDIEGIREVDAKLVALAQKFKCNVLTTDYNLNRVAQIQGVRVLNVNELSNAIRPVVLPGEELIVRVVQPGKERNQGVGYLADGTMIVVENGDKLMGQEVATEVTRVFQTVAGKMIFAVPKKGFVPSDPAPNSDPTTRPTTPVEAITPLAAEQLQPAKDAQPRKQQFGRRGRGNQNGNGNNNGGGSHNGQSSNKKIERPSNIEDRIIAATSEPDIAKD